jgi:hypothetical protein
MGIYGVKSNKCNCKGSWSTLTNDCRTYMEKPCSEHSLIVGNTIYYELKHLLNYITTNFEDIIIKEKYAVKILQIEKLTKNKTIIKIEVNHNGNLNVNNFDNSKQTFYSQMNDEPMWINIDDTIMHMIILYQSPHHTIEDIWEAFDY